MTKHIKIELDFIPVEERLPEEMKFVFVFEQNNWLGIGLLEDGIWFGSDRELSPIVGEDVTHWAEIPGYKQ